MNVGASANPQYTVKWSPVVACEHDMSPDYFTDCAAVRYMGKLEKHLESSDLHQAPISTIVIVMLLVVLYFSSFIVTLFYSYFGPIGVFSLDFGAYCYCFRHWSCVCCLWLK